MTTVVNNPPSSNNSGGGMGMVIGLIIVAVLAYLFFVYGLPMLQQVQVGAPQINVPSTIDVNVNQKQAE